MHQLAYVVRVPRLGGMDQTRGGVRREQRLAHGVVIGQGHDALGEATAVLSAGLCGQQALAVGQRPGPRAAVGGRLPSPVSQLDHAAERLDHGEPEFRAGHEAEPAEGIEEFRGGLQQRLVARPHGGQPVQRAPPPVGG